MNPPEKEILQMDAEQLWERIYGTKAPGPGELVSPSFGDLACSD
jgi:hypothetical protein